MWIKRLVIMLPSKNGNSKIGLNPSALFNKPHLYYFNGGAVYHECQHLYIISDEEIKENDWVYNSISNELEKWSYKGWIEAPDFEYLGYYKIIATTDESLMCEIPCPDGIEGCGVGHYKLLSRPSQQFIEKYIEEYNKGNIIKEVLVKYEEEPTDDGNSIKYIESLINPNNTINIKQIKDSWNREEVIKLCRSAHLHGEQGALNLHYQVFKQWIEENL